MTTNVNRHLSLDPWVVSGQTANPNVSRKEAFGHSCGSGDFALIGARTSAITSSARFAFASDAGYAQAMNCFAEGRSTGGWFIGGCWRELMRRDIVST